MNIVLTGSLGHISKPLAEILLDGGHAVTVISSTPGRQAAIEALGATAAIGSVEDAGFLARTFRGADAVYCMVPPNYGAPDPIAYYERVGRAYAAAIRASGVRRVVELSSYGAHLPEGTGFIVGSHRNEHTFNALEGVSVTHLRPGYFYYNLLPLANTVRALGFIASNYGGDDRMLLVVPEDIAAAAAEELTRPDGAPVRYVASDDRTCTEIAHVLGQAIGMPGLEWKVIPAAQVQQALEGAGMAPATAALLVELNGAIHSGILRADYDQHPVTPGAVKLDDYAQTFAAVYNGTAAATH